MTTTTKLSELTGDYVLDPARTRIGFAARAMVTKVRGQFGEFEGRVHLDGNDPVEVQRPAHDPDGQASRPASSSATTTCAATSWTPATTRPSPSPRPGPNGPTRPASRSPGDLTIRGVTKPVTVDFELTGAVTDPGGQLPGLRSRAQATINRRDWGVNWSAVTGVAGAPGQREGNAGVRRRRGPGVLTDGPVAAPRMTFRQGTEGQIPPRPGKGHESARNSRAPPGRDDLIPGELSARK